MSDPLVSVITPSYNRPDSIIGAIKTVSSQSYENIEHIIIDDNSAVAVSDVLSDTDYNVKIYRHNTNQGANVARNTGISLSSGEFIAFLDDDDKWTNDKIEKQINCAQASGAGIVYTGVKQISDTNVFSVQLPTIEGNITKEILVKNPIPTFSTIMVHRDLFDTVGNLNDQLPNWQDWEFYIRASLETKFAGVPEALVFRHHGRDDQISSDYEKKRDVSAPLIRQKYADLAADIGVQERFDARVERALGATAIEAGQYQSARSHYLSAVQKQLSLDDIFRLLALCGGGLTYKTIVRLRRRMVTLRDSQSYS